MGYPRLSHQSGKKQKHTHDFIVDTTRCCTYTFRVCQLCDWTNTSGHDWCWHTTRHEWSINRHRHLQIVGKLSWVQRSDGRQIPSTQRNEARLSTAFIDTSRVALARVSIRATASITTSIVTSAGVAVFGTITRTTSFFQTLLVAWRHRCNSTEPSRLTLESCTTARHSFGTSTCTAVFTIVATLDMD